jgi:hypothetical protein
MTPVDMHLLLMSLKAIERVCMQEKSNAQSGKKASNKGEKANKQPGTDATIRVPKKACAPRSIATSARSMGVCILCTIRETVVSIRKTEPRKPISAPPRKLEKTLSCKAVFCAVEQEIGQA